MDALSTGESTNYKDKSYHASRSNTSTATLSFIGTAISIYGSKASDHGTFSVTLDGTTQTLDGHNPTNVYQTLLFSQTGLPYGSHTLQVQNLALDSAQPWLYLDYFEFETGLDDNIRNADYNMDDNNSTISYLPPDAWGTTDDNISQYYGKTLHTSSTPSSQVSTAFDGNAISVFGSVGPSYGLVDVTIDSLTTVLNCSASTFRPQTLLFYAVGLPSERHSLKMQIPSNSSQRFDLDFLTITRWSDNNGLGRSKAKTPIIAGSICGALILLAWATYLGHWTWTQHQKRKRTPPAERKVSDAIALREDKKKGSQGTNGGASPKDRQASRGEEGQG